MNSTIESILQEYEARAAAEEQVIAQLHDTPGGMLQHRDEFLLSVGRGTAQLLHLLVTESRATRILEIGASYGYSTIWLADAARATGGRVTSPERHAGKGEYGRRQLARLRVGE